MRKYTKFWRAKSQQSPAVTIRIPSKQNRPFFPIPDASLVSEPASLLASHRATTVLASAGALGAVSISPCPWCTVWPGRGPPVYAVWCGRPRGTAPRHTAPGSWPKHLASSRLSQLSPRPALDGSRRFQFPAPPQLFYILQSYAMLRMPMLISYVTCVIGDGSRTTSP